MLPKIANLLATVPLFGSNTVSIRQSTTPFCRFRGRRCPDECHLVSGADPGFFVPLELIGSLHTSMSPSPDSTLLQITYIFIERHQIAQRIGRQLRSCRYNIQKRNKFAFNRWHTFGALKRRSVQLAHKNVIRHIRVVICACQPQLSRDPADKFPPR